jgi:hypothetical protein
MMAARKCVYDVVLQLKYAWRYGVGAQENKIEGKASTVRYEKKRQRYGGAGYVWK